MIKFPSLYATSNDVAMVPVRERRAKVTYIGPEYTSYTKQLPNQLNLPEDRYAMLDDAQKHQVLSAIHGDGLNMVSNDVIQELETFQKEFNRTSSLYHGQSQLNAIMQHIQLKPDRLYQPLQSKQEQIVKKQKLEDMTRNLAAKRPINRNIEAAQQTAQTTRSQQAAYTPPPTAPPVTFTVQQQPTARPTQITNEVISQGIRRRPVTTSQSTQPQHQYPQQAPVQELRTIPQPVPRQIKRNGMFDTIVDKTMQDFRAPIVDAVKTTLSTENLDNIVDLSLTKADGYLDTFSEMIFGKKPQPMLSQDSTLTKGEALKAKVGMITREAAATSVGKATEQLKTALGGSANKSLDAVITEVGTQVLMGQYKAAAVQFGLYLSSTIIDEAATVFKDKLNSTIDGSVETISGTVSSFFNTTYAQLAAIGDTIESWLPGDAEGIKSMWAYIMEDFVPQFSHIKEECLKTFLPEGGPIRPQADGTLPINLKNRKEIVSRDMEAYFKKHITDRVTQVANTALQLGKYSASQTEYEQYYGTFADTVKLLQLDLNKFKTHQLEFVQNHYGKKVVRALDPFGKALNSLYAAFPSAGYIQGWYYGNQHTMDPQMATYLTTLLEEGDRFVDALMSFNASAPGYLAYFLFETMGDKYN